MGWAPRPILRDHLACLWIDELDPALDRDSIVTPDGCLDSQQDDGGWPVAWNPPGRAALAEWRGIITLHNIRVLRAYV